MLWVGLRRVEGRWRVSAAGVETQTQRRPVETPAALEERLGLVDSREDR